MIQLQAPSFLWLLWLLPLLTALYLWQLVKAKRLWARIADKALLKNLIEAPSPMRRHLKFLCCMLALSLLIVCMARPYMATPKQVTQKKQVDVGIMVDVSNSMLADDIRPSRLERVKLLLRQFVTTLDRASVSLGVFAGEAYPQVPMTTDVTSLKQFVDALSTTDVTMQGTDISAAMRLAARGFSPKSKGAKVLIVLTDGENHEGGTDEAVAELKKAGIEVIIIGVGTTQGGHIPTANGYMTDRNGNIINTRLNETMCQQWATQTKGAYLHLDESNNALAELQKHIEQLRKTGTETATTATESDEQFQAVALLALLLLLLDIGLHEKSVSIIDRFHLFAKK